MSKGGESHCDKFYNPCNRLSMEVLQELSKHFEGKTIGCGDFNAHSTLWDGYDDSNGGVVEELMDEKSLVVLNGGSGTRMNVHNGNETAVDLTLESEAIAGICMWRVDQETTIGSDHYPIVIELGLNVEEASTGGLRGLNGIYLGISVTEK